MTTTGRRVVVLAGLALAAAFAGPGFMEALRGAISVPGGITSAGAEGGNYQPCATSGGYTGIRAGAQVVVTGAEGKVLAVGRLDEGALSLPSGASWGERSCVFSFKLPVPSGRPDGVEVAHRGTVVYSAAQLREHLVLSLGD